MALNRVLPGLAPGGWASDETRGRRQLPGGFPDRPLEVPLEETLDGPRLAPAREVDASPNGATTGHPMQPGQRARWTLGAMVGRSSEMERLFLQMRYLAGHLRIALIEGEPGTGKALAARTLHDLSPAKGRNFVRGSAPEFMAGFLTAPEVAAQLEATEGGTLYLSGIDALNPEGQGRLLQLVRWLGGAPGRPGPGAMGTRNGEERDGGSNPGPPRALILSTTRSLRSMVLRGSFRGELQAQVSAVQLKLPALRERREDIPMLVESILAHTRNAHGRPLCGILHEALPALLAQPWPGNVAELRDRITAAAARSRGEWLRRADLELPGAPGAIDPNDEGRSVPLRRIMPGVMPRFVDRGPARSGSVGENGTLWAAPRGESPRLTGIHMEPAIRAGVASLGRGAPQGGAHATANSAPHRRPQRVLHDPSDGHEEKDQDPNLNANLDPNLDRAIMRHIRRVLASVGGNKLRAAKLLGISRSTLYRLLDADTAGSARPSPGERPLLSAMGR